MDLIISLDEILTGRLRKNELVSFLKKHPELFEETIRISLKDKQPQSWRAAWLIGHYMNVNDALLRSHIDAMLSCIKDKEDGHQRELLKIINKMDLNEDQESRLFNVCLSIWEEVHKSPSVRGTAFQTLLNIVKKYPELKGEIEHLTQSHYIGSLSPGIKHSLYKIIGGENE